MQAKYRILQISRGLFELYEADLLLATFSRQNVRERLEDCNRSSNWVGAILRLLNRNYPPPVPYRCEDPVQRALGILGEKGLADYLRSKGYRAVKPLRGVSDRDVIACLESLGYEIEGIVDGCYYSTASSKKAAMKEALSDGKEKVSLRREK